MLHKYYYIGYSNNYNLKFECPTNGEVWTLKHIKDKLRSLIENEELEEVLRGYKQFLYFEKSDNTNRYWKVVIGVWRNKSDFDSDLDPLRVIRITTDNFREIVRDKYTNNLYDEIPIKEVCEDEDIMAFY